MALRNLNKHLSKPNLKKTETVKSTIIIKVTNLCEEQFNSETRAPRELIDSAISTSFEMQELSKDFLASYLTMKYTRKNTSISL